MVIYEIYETFPFQNFLHIRYVILDTFLHSIATFLFTITKSTSTFADSYIFITQKKVFHNYENKSHYYTK